MKKLILIAGLVASMGAVADTPVHKVTPEYNSGFCFGMGFGYAPNDYYNSPIKKGDPMCTDGKHARLQSDLERQLSKEQVSEIKELLGAFRNECREGERWIAFSGCR